MRTTYDHGTGVAPRFMGVMRVMGFFGLIILLTPVQILFDYIKPDKPFCIPQLFHKILVRVLGIKVRQHGAPLLSPRVLFVANHASYLDIPVLNSLTPAAFVAKADVRKWPLIGTLAALQKTVFIERVATRAEAQRNVLKERLEAGQSLVLFPEGTSSEGTGILPFKSSLFSIAEEMGITVQPVSVVCTELDNLPITRANRPYYAWFGDMTLLGHLWNVFKFGRFTVDVIYHAPVSAKDFPNRKALALYCQEQVAQGIQQSIGGRLGAPAPQLAIPAATPALVEAKNP